MKPVDFHPKALDFIRAQRGASPEEIQESLVSAVYAFAALTHYTRGLEQGRTRPIRGGTDGSRLSFVGLPTPNLFAGEHNFHSRLEWTSRQDLEKGVELTASLVASRIVSMSSSGPNGFVRYCVAPAAKPLRNLRNAFTTAKQCLDYIKAL